MPRKGMRTGFFRSNSNLTPPTPRRRSSSVSPRAQSNRLMPLYSFSDSIINDTFVKAEQMINKWNPENSMFYKPTCLFQENRMEAQEFVKCVKDLQRAINFLLSEHPNNEKLLLAENLMEIAMKRLVEEFYQILSMNRDHLDSELISTRTSRSTFRSSRSRSSLSDYEDEPDQSEDEIQTAEKSISNVEKDSKLTMEDIKLIADCMIASGYGKECVKIYKTIRKSIVDESIYRLGIVHIKSAQIRKMDWEVLELKLNNWLTAVKVAVRLLFNGERTLCDHVFAGNDAIRESCFTDISKEGAKILFGFPKKVAKCKKPAPERVFRILDVYTTLAELWPQVEMQFSFESTASVKSRVLKSLTRIGDFVRAMILEFESAIQKDPSRSHIQGGAVHPLTRNVMNYVSLLSEYQTPLTDIFTNWPLPINSPLPESYLEGLNSGEDPSPVAVRFAWMILVLLSKIDMKVESYKDVSLSYLFLANNLQYVVMKVRTTDLRLILGDEWISKHEEKVRQYICKYEKLGWGKVFASLPENPTAALPRDEAKSCFKRFNHAFETACKTQSSWVISDLRLRDDIEVSICKKIVPIYTQFYEKYKNTVKSSHVKFTPDELTNYISGLFYDKNGSGDQWSRCREQYVR